MNLCKANIIICHFFHKVEDNDGLDLWATRELPYCRIENLISVWENLKSEHGIYLNRIGNNKEYLVEFYKEKEGENYKPFDRFDFYSYSSDESLEIAACIATAKAIKGLGKWN